MNKIFLASTLLFILSCSQDGTKQSNDALYIGIDSDIRNIDSRYATDANSQYLENLIHCSIISFDKNGKVENRLARSIDWINPKKLKVTIGEKTFSNGEKVTSKDIKSTYDFFLDNSIKDLSSRRFAFQGIDSIETPSEEEVIFNLKNADATFSTNLVIGILPAKLASAEKIREHKSLIGCGEFKLSEKKFSGLKLERVKPSLEKVNTIWIKVIKDESTRLAKLLKGELDIVQNSLGREQAIEAAKKDSSLELLRRSGLNTTYIGFNFKDPILSKKEVRQAINYAINRDEIIKYVLKGFGTKATSLLTPSNPYKAIHSGGGLKLEKAEALLEKAGFKKGSDGIRLKLDYKTTTNTTRVVIAKAIAAQLSKVGIKVNVQSMDWGKFKKDVEKGNVQMWSLSWIGFKDPDIYRYIFATESFPPNGGNRGWFSHSELDRLLSQGKVETDSKKRESIYQKVENIVQDEVPYSYLWHEEVFALVNSRVKGFELYSDGRLQSLENVSVK